MPLMSPSDSNACHWLLDVRSIWQGQKIDDAAPEPLACVSSEEADKARRFMFLKDAKLSLGSSLLKRLFASKIALVPWHYAHFERAVDPKHGKPCLVAASNASYNQPIPSAASTSNPEQGSPTIDFNVTHQAGLVALAGCYSKFGSAIRSIGVDIVCVDERDSAEEIIRKHDFNYWVDIHAEVFSPADVAAMKAPIVQAQKESEVDVLQMLRRFYAFWALKEAYVKLQGEALLADWLKDVVFHKVRVPSAASTSPDSSEPGKGTKWGETIEDIEVWMYGKKKEDVLVFLQAFEQNYMVATMYLLATPQNKDDVSSPRYDILDVEQDILPWAAEAS